MSDSAELYSVLSLTKVFRFYRRGKSQLKRKNNFTKNKKTPQFLEEFCVGLLGLEPRKTAPKTVVLPLHHRPIPVLLSECKFRRNFNFCKFLIPFSQKTFRGASIIETSLKISIFWGLVLFLVKFCYCLWHSIKKHFLCIAK